MISFLQITYTDELIDSETLGWLRIDRIGERTRAGTGAASAVGTGEGGEMERAGATGGGRNGKRKGGPSLRGRYIRGSTDPSLQSAVEFFG
jgi:hypothetical protein